MPVRPGGTRSLATKACAPRRAMWRTTLRWVHEPCRSPSAVPVDALHDQSPVLRPAKSVHDGGLILRAVVPGLSLFERREFQDYCAFDGLALRHAQATIGSSRREAVSLCGFSGLLRIALHLLGIVDRFAQRDEEC